VRLERVLGVPTEAAGAFNCVVAASNKWSTFNCVDDLPTKSQASILAHLNMRYTKREMLNVEPKAGQRGLSVARITTCTYT
jgi:hypothetical protein